MLAQLSAFDVLAFLIVFGTVGALCGWAGGAGARLTFAMRLDRVEGVVLTILNRAKGAAGGTTAQLQKQRFTSAEKEAEALAAKLAAAPRRRGFGFPGGRAMSPIDQAEEQSFAEIEAAQKRLRKSEQIAKEGSRRPGSAEQIAKEFLDDANKNGAA